MGVASALAAGKGGSQGPSREVCLECTPPDTPARPTLFSKEFALNDRVALVTGGHRGIGLEAALALVEAGARVVYCADLPDGPSEQWQKVRDYAARMEGKSGEGRLEYISADTTDYVSNAYILRDTP